MRLRSRRALASALALAAALLVGTFGGDVRSEQAAPAQSKSLAAATAAMTGDKAWKEALVGVSIVDVESGAVLASYNEHAALNPASNAKLYTAAAALAILHGDRRFETSLSGNVKGTDVSNLTLRGGGDPSLETEDLYDLVLELRARGIRRVDGDLFVDQKYFDGETTPPAFEQKPGEWAAFRAPVSALAVNENTVTLQVRPTEAGKGAHVFFDPPGFVDVEGGITTGEGADTVVLGLAPSGRRLAAKLSGSVGADAKLVRYSRRVDDPTLLGGYVLKAQLEREGIAFSGEVKAGNGKGNVLAKHTSAPLSTLLYALGKQSDNFYAEMIFKDLGAEAKGTPAKADAAAAAVAKHVEDVGAKDAGLVFKNGSGLYDANRVTADSMTKLLRASYRDGAIGPEFVAQLAIGGVDGTLHKRFHGQARRRCVRAKTGTLDDAIALSGYVLGPAGKGPIAFSIVFNKVAGKASAARIAADKLVEAIVRELWG
jgi:D-alanyl-D-alanine carboxypeptidase/D-alanyl-D-alanine-endopeptidase (penicillin-binding protein 4)